MTDVPRPSPPRRRLGRLRRRLAVLASACALAPILALAVVPWLRVALQPRRPSRSSGTRADGSLDAGRPMPPRGDGFVTYSRLGATLGRQYLHGDARDTLVESFAAAAARAPGRVHVIAETGWSQGGRMRPHRTHANGLSADVLMPLRARDGSPRRMPTPPWRSFGYGNELDAKGALDSGLRADFDELAAWLIDLDAAARRHSLRIERVIIAPEYVPLVLATPHGAKLGSIAPLLSRRSSWIRHDEHVHVDFAIVAR